MATELFMSMTGVKMVHVPYKGGGPAIVDLIAGNVELGFSTMATAIGPIKTGRTRALGVTSGKRFELLPDVPTIAEAGVPGYESVGRFAIFVPLKTPEAIIARLNQEIVRVLGRADAIARLNAAGIEAVGSTPAQLTAVVKDEMATLGKVIRDAGMRVE